MGRELKRKQAKRDGKNVKEVQKKNKDKPLSPKTFITILVVLLLFFVILYLITGLFITKVEEEYYVYYYDSTEEDTEVSNTLYSVSEKVYRVDLNDAFNSNFVGEPSGIVEDIDSLKVSNPTLIKVSSEKIIAFYNGAEEIKIALE